MDKLHFHTSLTEKIGVLTEKNTCKDIVIDRQTERERLDSIYVGKVRNVDSSIDAAFIDLGMDKAGFLAKGNIPFIKKEEELSSCLTEGSSIIVQVTKEAYQDKGPRLTANITLSGKNIVYVPNGNYIASSKKIPNDVKQKWKSLLRGNLIEKEGLILRTNCLESSEELVIQELIEIRSKWKKLQQNAEKISAPVLLWHFPLVPNQIINQYQSFPIKAITFDEKRMMRKMQTAFPHLESIMSVRKQADQIETKSMTQWIEEALQPIVKKEDGITLTIEETEALTVIDIDSNQFHSRHNKRNTIFRINKQAVNHCVEEIRKRNISGIIMIDFLKMKKEEEYIIVADMKKALQKDPVRTEIYGFTKLGLMELTRKRERASLSHLMTKRSLMSGKSTEAISFQLERELLDWNQSNIEAMIIKCHPDVVTFMSNQLYDELLEKLTFTLYFQTDHQEKGYSVIRSGSTELVELYLDENREVNIDSLQ